MFLYVICFRIIHFILISSARVIFDVSSGFYLWNVNRIPTWHLSKMFKVAFKDVSTKNSEPTYLTIHFVMLKIYFIYKVAGKKSRRAIYNWTMSSASQTPALPVMRSLVVLVNKRADWNVPVSYITCHLAVHVVSALKKHQK